MDFSQGGASFLSSSLLVASHVLAHESSAEMNTALAWLSRDAEAIGHLADGELLHVGQQNHLAVRVRQRLQRTNDVDTQVVLGNLRKVLSLVPLRQLFCAPYQRQHGKH